MPSAKVFGIFGCTCAGKTTLSLKLVEELQKEYGLDVHHILQDDFFLTPEKVDRVPHAEDPAIQFYHYDRPSALNVTGLLAAIEQRVAAHQLVILEGNLLTLLPEVCELVDRIFFLTLDYGTCVERRVKRTDYEPADPPGYFEQIVWPAYELTLQKAKELGPKVSLVHGKRSELFDDAVKEIHDTLNNYVRLQTEDIDVNVVSRKVESDSSGAISLFLGTTRDNFDGQKVARLDYEAYEPMAYKELYRICKEVRITIPDLEKIAIIHKLGDCPVGKKSVAIAVSSPHRTEAIRATEFIIDELKRRVPIWKKEVYSSGDSSWKANNDCINHSQANGNSTYKKNGLL